MITIIIIIIMKIIMIMTMIMIIIIFIQLILMFTFDFYTLNTVQIDIKFVVPVARGIFNNWTTNPCFPWTKSKQSLAELAIPYRK